MRLSRKGLLTVATTTLAFGIEDMRKRNVLVRRLDAVETLGFVRVVCFDKTGTLTSNRMSVAELDCGGQRLRSAEGGLLLDEAGKARSENALVARLLEIGALCSETRFEEDEAGVLQLNGSATENALVALR